MGNYRPHFGPGGWAENLSEAAIAAEIKHRQQQGENLLGVCVVPGNTIIPQPVRWLWNGWLACGKVHLIAGAPGTGKTSIALALAATITIGGRWPDGEQAQTGHVLIWSGEDDPKDTLVPRLLACGADMDKVHFVTGMVEEKGSRAFDPACDIQPLADHLATMDPTPDLLLIDPIVSAVAGDSHKNAEVRRSLQPMVDLGQTRGCAVIGITHFSKGSAGRDPVERMTGSLAFGALVRIGMVAAKLPDDQGGGRVLARAKNNLGPDTGGFGYDLHVCEPVEGIQTTSVVWGEALDGTAREILRRAEDLEDPEMMTARSDAIDFLKIMLENGPVPSKRIFAEAREAGHAERTIRRAKDKLGVMAIKEGRGPWKWSLSPEDGQGGQERGQDGQGGHVGQRGTDGHLGNVAKVANGGHLQNHGGNGEFTEEEI